jgi:hypothetical protein
MKFLAKKNPNPKALKLDLAVFRHNGNTIVGWHT